MPCCTKTTKFYIHIQAIHKLRPRARNLESLVPPPLTRFEYPTFLKIGGGFRVTPLQRRKSDTHRYIAGSVLALYIYDLGAFKFSCRSRSPPESEKINSLAIGGRSETVSFFPVSCHKGVPSGLGTLPDIRFRFARGERGTTCQYSQASGTDHTPRPEMPLPGKSHITPKKHHDFTHK